MNFLLKGKEVFPQDITHTLPHGYSYTSGLFQKVERQN